MKNKLICPVRRLEKPGVKIDIEKEVLYLIIVKK